MDTGFFKIYNAMVDALPGKKRGFYKYGDLGTPEEKTQLWERLSELSGEDLVNDKSRFNEMLDYVDARTEEHIFYSYTGKKMVPCPDFYYHYCAIDTGLIACQTKKSIYVCFEKKNKKGNPYSLVKQIHDLSEFQNWIKTHVGSYSLGKSGLVFRSVENPDGTVSTGKDEALKFLAQIADAALPEPWNFKETTPSKHPKKQYPILQNYLEYIFLFLKDNDKIVDCGDKIGFNTNLLDRWFNPICLVADVEGKNLFVNLRRVKGELEAKRLGFGDYPFPEPQFFANIGTVVYQPSLEVYDTDNPEVLEHISDEEHLKRGTNYTEKTIDDAQKKDLADDIKQAIEDSKKLAARNHSFIVPQYRPEVNENGENEWRIQFLMPLYFKSQYKDKPDYILVLNPERLPSGEECYVVKTTLRFDQAYGNARLLTKPDNTWLDPTNIEENKEPSEEDA